MCLTGYLSCEFFDVCFNVLHDESSIFSYDISLGSYRIRNNDYVCPWFHPPWLIHILCQILIEQIDGFWFSIKDIWEFKDGSVKDIEACGWGIIDGDCRIFLFVSQGKWYDCWDVRCWINSSSSCWKVPPPPPLGDVSLGVDKEIDLVDLAISSAVALVSWSQLLILIRITSKILSLDTSYGNLTW